MMRYALTILAVTLVLARAVAAVSPPGSEAAAMLRKVQASASAKNHPEEFNNFIDAINSAKMQIAGW